MRTLDPKKTMLSLLTAAALVVAAPALANNPNEDEPNPAEAHAEEGMHDAEAAAEDAKSATEDAAITAKVKSKLIANPEINPFDIDVDTTNGVVRLSGTVEEDIDRSEAERLASDTEGVVKVQNDLQLGDTEVAENDLRDDEYDELNVDTGLDAEGDRVATTTGTTAATDDEWNRDDDAMVGEETDTVAATGDTTYGESDEWSDERTNLQGDRMSDDEMGDEALPRTASPLPLILLTGLGGLGAAAGLRRRRE